MQMTQTFMPAHFEQAHERLLSSDPSALDPEHRFRLLFLGDVVGRAGRNAIKEFVPGLVTEHEIDLVVANGENLVSGKGIDERTAGELFDSGVHVITGGNHSWAKKEAFEFIKKEPRLLRPLNYPNLTTGAPGTGVYRGELRNYRFAVVNLLGRVHMEPSLDCPFQAAEQILTQLRREGISIIFIDFHGEVTSEKQAFAHYFAGRASAVVGTHTHVQTADERLILGGERTTAYLTDAGMTGPYESVIGMLKERSVERFVTKLPQKYEVAERRAGLHGVLLDIHGPSGNALNLRRISYFLD